jgi:hypothetical protein
LARRHYRWIDREDAAIVGDRIHDLVDQSRCRLDLPSAVPINDLTDGTSHQRVSVVRLLVRVVLV